MFKALDNTLNIIKHDLKIVNKTNKSEFNCYFFITSSLICETECRSYILTIKAKLITKTTNLF